jgi:hypothetical protein
MSSAKGREARSHLGARDLRVKIGKREKRRCTGENDCRTFIPQRRVGSKKVIEAGPERFRKEDRHPIKYFNFGRDDVVERHRSPRRSATFRERLSTDWLRNFCCSGHENIRT